MESSRFSFGVLHCLYVDDPFICSFTVPSGCSSYSSSSNYIGVASRRGTTRAASTCSMICSNYSTLKVEVRTRNHRESICRAGMKGNGHAFFESSIVQAESQRLESDYKHLVQLGIKYGRFDREGKLFYVDEMKKLIERWQIFYKRMDLTDDFAATIYAKQLKTQVGPLGLSNVDLADSIHVVLDEMKKDADAGL